MAGFVPGVNYFVENEPLAGFFDLIDENHDGVVSTAELLNAINNIWVPLFNPPLVASGREPIPVLTEEMFLHLLAIPGNLPQHQLNNMNAFGVSLIVVEFFHRTVEHIIPDPNEFGLRLDNENRLCWWFNQTYNPAPVLPPVFEPEPGPVFVPEPGPGPALAIDPDADYQECSLCLDPMNDGREVMKCNQCNRWHHTDCIQPVCNGPDGQRKCPNCRGNWPQGCAGLIRRAGPVIGLPSQGGKRRSRKNRRKTNKNKNKKKRGLTKSRL